MEIPIRGTHGVDKTLLIDDADLVLLQGRSVFMLGDSCPAIAIHGREIYVHRIVAAFMGLRGEIDHQNRNKCDVRRQNLREVKSSQNGRR
jgi:hypothetical protein